MQQLSFSPLIGTQPLPSFAPSLASIIDKLFCLPLEKVENELGMYDWEVYGDDLLSGIWNHPNHCHEDKVRLVSAVIQNISLFESLCSLFKSDPLTALFILVSLEDGEAAREMLESFLEDIEDYRILLDTWTALAYSGWDDPSLKSEPLELLLAIMTPEERARLFDTCCADKTPVTIAKLACLLISSPYSNEFANSWGERFDHDEDLEDKCCQLVQLIIAENTPCQRRPSILTALMNFEGEENDLDKVLYDNLSKFSDTEQAVILWCLAPLSLSNLIKELDPEVDRDRMLEYLNKILSLPDTLENRVMATGIFVNTIRDEEVLIAWLMAMVDLNSPAIPYIWIVFRDDLFSFIVTDPGSNALRTRLLSLATSRPIPHFQEYILALTSNSNRLTYLINLCTMDIASQTQVHVADQMFAKWMSFNDVGEYLLDGVISGDLSDKMARFEADFKRVPSLFFAIGMSLPMQRQWIVPSAIHCSDNQLKAIAQMMPTEESCDTLEHLGSLLMLDQFKTVLSHLSPVHFRKYVTWKGGQTKKSLEQLRKSTQIIRDRTEKIAAKVEEGESFYDETLEMCFQQMGRINLFKNYNLLIIRDLCLEKSRHSTDIVWSVIPGCMHSSDHYKDLLLGPFGLMKKLENLAPSKAEPLAFDITSLPTEDLYKVGASKWADVGIRSEEDLQHLGFKGVNYDYLVSYLYQTDLVETWKVLCAKQLRDIDTLISGCIATTPELFDLKTFSQKL